MLEGLYSAAAGMAAQQQRMDSVANDLANVNTNGYKHERVGLPRPALRRRRGSGNVHSGAGAAATNSAAASPRARCARPGNPLDVAIEGQGFLRVRRADGTEALTRDGSLQHRRAGPARHLSGASSCSRAITVPAGTNESDGLDRPGRHGHREQPRARHASSSSTSARPQALQPIGDNLFRTTGRQRRRANATGARLDAGLRSRPRTSTSATRWST